MKFTFACKKVTLNDSIKDYAAKKLSKLDRFFREEADAFVTFSVEKDHRCGVEVTIRGGNTLFERQILKNKTRLAKRLRSDAFPATAPEDAFEVTEEKEFDVVRTKHFAVKPMSTEEAIMQMNLLDHDFFVFRNMDTETISVVYQRKNGGYGLIETD